MEHGKRCIIFCAGPMGREDLLGLTREPGDFIIGADGGYLHARGLGFEPDLILGDFDSAPPPQQTQGVVVHPTHKDDTDCFLAVEAGLERGCREFILLGATGGRLDHTVANIQTLAYLAKQGACGELRDRNTRMTVLHNGQLSLRLGEGLPKTAYLSLFALDGDCVVSETGVEYPLNRYTLTGTRPLGVSNHIQGPAADITATGTLLVMQCRDDHDKEE